MTYEKAMAEVVLFDDSDIITASGCVTYSNINDVDCYYGLTETGF